MTTTTDTATFANRSRCTELASNFFNTATDEAMDRMNEFFRDMCVTMNTDETLSLRDRATEALTTMLCRFNNADVEDLMQFFEKLNRR